MPGHFTHIYKRRGVGDDNQVIFIGSPLSQSYWDTHAHPVFEPLAALLPARQCRCMMSALG
jgi:hypothetical protein